ncbi:MAG: hypothetical protein V3T30_06915 [Thermodesulfobacteriota bacterium]
MRSSLKRIKWVFLLIPIIVFFLPSVGNSALKPIDPRDPFIGRILSLNVSYEVEQTSSKNKETQRFLQYYDLRLRGNYIDPRLFVYTAGITFINSTNEGTYSEKQSYDSWEARFNTILLRQLKFPLTLTFKRRVTKQLPGTLNATYDFYSLQWLFKFKKLPVTHLRVERNVSSGADEQHADQYYEIEMTKDYGRTSNFFGFTASQSDDANSTSVTFTNNTFLTKYTHLNVAVHSGTAEFEDSTGLTSESTTSGVSMSLSSRPSRYFNQNHAFTTYSNEGVELVSEGMFYNGDFHFNPTDDIASNFFLSISEQDGEAKTTTFNYSNLLMGGDIRYRLSRRIRITERLTMSRASSENTEIADGITESETLQSTTSVTYSRRLPWASFSAEYGLGYLQEQVTPNGEGKSMTNLFKFNLSGMRTKRFRYTAGAGYSKNTNISGNSWSNSRNIRGNMANLIWKRYLSFNIGVNKTFYESWIKNQDSESLRYSFAASTNYFKRTSILFNYNALDRTTSRNGDSSSVVRNLIVKHHRLFWRGRFTFEARLRNAIVENETSNGSELSTSSYGITYRKLLLGRVRWTLAGIRTSSEDAVNSFEKTTESLTNNFDYYLRAWRLSLLHKQESSESNYFGAYEETKILFKASRGFAMSL